MSIEMGAGRTRPSRYAYLSLVSHLTPILHYAIFEGPNGTLIVTAQTFTFAIHR